MDNAPAVKNEVMRATLYSNGAGGCKERGPQLPPVAERTHEVAQLKMRVHGG
jgi:hypothetical protein